MSEPWWRREADGLRLAVRVQPRAGTDRVVGIQGGRLKLRIAAAPVDEAANERLVAYLSGLFDVPRAQVRLLQGARSRDKLVAIAGAERLPPALAALDEGG